MPVLRRPVEPAVINGPGGPEIRLPLSPESGLKSDIAPCPFCAQQPTFELKEAANLGGLGTLRHEHKGLFGSVSGLN